MDLVVVLEVMLELLAIMLLGYFLFKKGILNPEVSKKLSWLVVNVTAPLLVLYAMYQVEDGGERSIVIHTLLLGLICYTGFIALAFVLSKVLWVPKGTRGIYQFILVFANTGFMGYPVIQSLFGTGAVFYASIYGIAFNLYVYTYGIWVIKNDCGSEGGVFRWQSLINPGIISSVLAMVFFLADVKLPEVVIDLFGSLGNMTTPLSMLILGASMGEFALGELFRDRKLYSITFLRLIALPLLMYVITSACGVAPLLVGIVTVSAAMPAASMAVMLATTYDGNIEFASKSVVFSTLLSIVTLPIVMAITHLSV